MKVFILGATAAWVIAVIAGHSCVKYCVNLLTGNRDNEVELGCDCIYQEAELYEKLEDSGIYYEPAESSPVPEYVHKQPFHIFNPLVQHIHKYPTYNNLVSPVSVQPSFDSRRHNTEIDINLDNIYTTHNRQEKDIQSTNQRSSAPLYLDISIGSEDERSASMSTFTTEELKIIEQSLSECAEFYVLLYDRKSKDTNVINSSTSNLSKNYDPLSVEELIDVVNNKCAQMSYIVEKSLSEIKNTRPKKTSVALRMNGDTQQNNEVSNPTGIPFTNKHSICTITTEDSSLSPGRNNEDNESRIKQYVENEGRTVVIYTENSSDETTDKASTMTTEVTSTNAPATLSNTQSSYINYPKMEVVTTEAISTISSTYTDNQYPLYTETVTSGSENMTSLKSVTFPDIVTASASIVEQGLWENNITDQEFRATNIELRTGNRSLYKEGEVPLTKIITHEYHNNTVQSYINGTEDIPNGDFKDEIEPIVISNEKKSSSEIVPYSHYTNPTDDKLKSTTPSKAVPKPDVSGNLYFLFNKHQIPAKFVQNLNGTVDVGIDGATLCNKLTEDGQRNSTLLTTLCNCYLSGNCKDK